LQTIVVFWINNIKPLDSADINNGTVEHQLNNQIPGNSQCKSVPNKWSLLQIKTNQREKFDMRSIDSAVQIRKVVIRKAVLGSVCNICNAAKIPK